MTPHPERGLLTMIDRSNGRQYWIKNPILTIPSEDIRAHAPGNNSGRASGHAGNAAKTWERRRAQWRENRGTCQNKNGTVRYEITAAGGLSRRGASVA